MSGPDIVLAAGAVIALAGAAIAVLPRNIFHNILGFALAMLGVAAVFLGMGADFVAAVFVLVYVGAVAIAMVYAVMLSHPLDQPRRPRNLMKVTGAAGLAALTGIALMRVLRAIPLAPTAADEVAVDAAVIGRRFLTDYVLAFELISVLLLVAMMGAVMVARRARAGRGTW